MQNSNCNCEKIVLTIHRLRFVLTLLHTFRGQYIKYRYHREKKEETIAIAATNSVTRLTYLQSHATAGRKSVGSSVAKIYVSLRADRIVALSVSKKDPGSRKDRQLNLVL